METNNLGQVVLVKDIAPVGSYFNGSYPGNFTVLDGKLYFGANNGINGTELWVTDGSSAGTQLVKDINPGNGSNYGFFSYSEKSKLPIFNGKLYFSGNNRVYSQAWVCIL